MKTLGSGLSIFLFSFLACALLAPKASARDCVCRCYIDGQTEGYLDNLCQERTLIHKDVLKCTAGPSGNLPLMYCRHWTGGLFSLVGKSCNQQGATGASDWMKWNPKTKRWLGSAGTEFACNEPKASAKAGSSSTGSDDQLVRASEGRTRAAPLNDPRGQEDTHL